MLIFEKISSQDELFLKNVKQKILSIKNRKTVKAVFKIKQLQY